MTSLLFPDAGSRRAEDSAGRPAANKTAIVYADAEGTTLAEIYVDSNGTPGAAITDATLTTDSYGMLPLFWGPTSGVDKLWVSVNAGPVWPVNADYDSRVDAIAARVTTLEAGDIGGGGGGEDGPGLAVHIADTTDVHGIDDTALLETAAGAQAKVDTHNTATTDVHGIGDTALLETGEGAQNRVDTHAALTTGVHGIADTAALETVTGAQTKADTAHAAAVASSAQRAANLSDLTDPAAARTNLQLGGAAALNVGDTTGTVAAGNDGRFSDARTPVVHAPSHAAAGSDPITITQAQVTDLTNTLDAKADLVGGVIPSSQIPPLNINAVYTVSSEAEMLALPAFGGDLAIRDDLNPIEFYLLTGTDPAVLAAWTPVSLSGAVASVNGQSGAVVLGAADVGAVPTSRSISAGSYLSGGGDLSTNRVLSATVGTTAGTLAAGDDSRITGAVQPSRAIATTAPLSGGGNLSTDRTLTVAGATTSAVGVIQLAGDLAGTATTPTLAAGAVTSTKIADGTIVDGDINTAAAIAQSKISGLTAALAAKADTTALAGKVDTGRLIGTTAPLTGGGDLTDDLTLAVAAATDTTVGVIQLAGDLTGAATAPTIAAGAVTSAKIADGTITDTDINAGAAIAQTKIAGLITAFTDRDTAIATKVGKAELVVNVLDHNAAGNGTTDDTAAINAAIAAAIAANRTLYLPPLNYRITTALSAITGPLTITGHGATITQATAGVGALPITASDVHIHGLTIAGPGGTSSHASQPKGIAVTGTSAAAPTARVKIVDCRITGFRGYGIHTKWATQVEIRNCTVRDMWYGGILMLSTTQSAVVGCDVSDINDTVNAYGIIASRAELGTTLETDPRCSDIVIANNRVSNIPTWEGIDTHAGQRISVIGNIITGCKVGVAVGAAQDTTNTLNTYAPLDCVVADNIIDSQVADGTAGHGIGFTGASDSDERATGTIRGNIIRGHGTESNGNQGAIYAHTTMALAVTGNTIINPSPIGVALYHDNTGYTVSGNTIIDPWTDTGVLATCVSSTSTQNTGTVGDNAFLRGPLTGKAVIGGEGVRVNNVSGNGAVLGANYATVTLPVSDSGRLTYSVLGRGRAYASTGSPEGTQNGALGSIYENINGGAGATLFYKESGSGGATGWRQVAGCIDASATLDFPSIAAGGTSELTISVSGASVGDPVHLGPPSTLNNGLLPWARVSATNVVTVRLHNATGSSINPVSASWRVRVSK